MSAKDAKFVRTGDQDASEIEHDAAAVRAYLYDMRELLREIRDLRLIGAVLIGLCIRGGRDRRG